MQKTTNDEASVPIKSAVMRFLLAAESATAKEKRVGIRSGVIGLLVGLLVGLAVWIFRDRPIVEVRVDSPGLSSTTKGGR
jgi:hypothetical protein